MEEKIIKIRNKIEALKDSVDLISNDERVPEFIQAEMRGKSQAYWEILQLLDINFNEEKDGED